MNINTIFFIILALGAIITGILTITRKNPVSSAMWLVTHFFTLSGLYLTLQAQFVAVIQILVYAGAIMVLVVFVIMLLNLGKDTETKAEFDPKKVLGGIVAFAFAILLFSNFLAQKTPYTGLHETAAKIGTVESIGTVLYSDYIFPFEAVSLLL
ncbi:MAG TPA: NADH-quinone oxidoreductase subunit J, partial [Patescibacteria group bacterium]|nr:NADH-quinone oxidoreductase subunit J [Patescibacteria group bacterium]